jgi:Zn-dependent oligopeptidase
MTGHTLDPAQQRIVEASIREAELSGVGLDGEAKERFNQIQQDPGRAIHQILEQRAGCHQRLSA